MEWKNWALLAYAGVLVLGLALAFHPFYVHTHHHRGHIAVKANHVGCPPNEGGQRYVNYTELSSPVQRVVDKAVRNEGERVVVHSAELINGDENNDWMTDSPREAQAAEQLIDLSRDEMIVERGSQCYRFEYPGSPASGLPLGQAILVLAGLFLVANGAYYGWKNIQVRT